MKTAATLLPSSTFHTTQKKNEITFACPHPRSTKMEIAFASVAMLGHMIPLLPYVEVLLHRGHSVTFFHHEDPKYRRLLESCGLEACKSVTFSEMLNIYDCIREYYSSRQQQCNVIVWDFFATDAADAADSLGIPNIGVFPNLAITINPWAATVLEQQTWKWRLWTFAIIPTLEQILARILWMRRSHRRWSRGLAIFWEQDIYPVSRYDMPKKVIGTTTPELEWNSFENSNFTMVGPSLPTKTESLTSELEQWMNEEARKGKTCFIYVAFGSMKKLKRKDITILEEQLTEVVQKHDDVAVLWSLRSDSSSSSFLPSIESIRIQSHVPQQALFRTGKVSAFVTHCGANSVMEAILAGIPMIGCPGFADQPGNAARLSRLGVIRITKNYQDVAQAIHEVLQNRDFSIQSQALSQSVRTHGGAERAATLVEEMCQGQTIEATENLRRRSCWLLWGVIVASASIVIARTTS